MKTVVVYHRSDFDGIFCREIARKFLPDAELIGWDFADEPLAIPDGQIYILDLPADRVFGFDFSEQSLDLDRPFPKRGEYRAFINRLVWIDHHASSIASHPNCIPGYRIDGVAACRLAWQWFMREGENLPDYESFVGRGVEEPLAVRLVGEYDVWDQRDPQAELFQHGLRSEELDADHWTALLTTDWTGAVAVNQLLQQGRPIQYAREQEYAEVIRQQGFTAEFEGVKFLACCSHELDIRSQLFAGGIRDEHDALLGFTFNGRDWRVSMYQIPGREHIDILGIAVKRGGGGHKGACGFRAATLHFLNPP